MERGGAAVAGVDPDELARVARRVLDRARPGEDVEVVVAASSSTGVRAYGGEVESLTVAEVAGIGVRVVAGGRQGFASAGSLDDDVVDEVLADARDNLAFAEPDEHVLVARPDGVAPVDLDLWSDEVASTPTDAKVAMAIELERLVRAGDPRITGVRSSGYGDSAGMSLIATTTGIWAPSRRTSASVGVLALARDGDATQSGAGSDVARHLGGLDLEKAAAEAVARATALLGATKPDSTKLTLVLEPRMAASLLGIVAGMTSGDRVLKGRTPLAGRVGELIGAPSLTIVDDPTDAESYGARTHDGEGLATRRNPLVVDGVLQGFLYDSQTASKAGTVSTASAVRSARSTPGVSWQALSVAPGADGSIDELIAGVDHGLFLHAMTGLHSGVNAVSGDFSVGVEGLMIRDGELAEPVREATVASTLLRLLADVIAVGGEVERLSGGVSCPPIVIADVSLSGR